VEDCSAVLTLDSLLRNVTYFNIFITSDENVNVIFQYLM
jgi:hypothetical protein